MEAGGHESVKPRLQRVRGLTLPAAVLPFHEKITVR